MCVRPTYLLPVLLVLVVGTARADLVSHWMLDEGGGTTAYDSGPGGNDGTLLDNPSLDDPTWIAGVKGGAVEFYGTGVNGTGGDYFDCGSDASLDITGPLSIALWIRPDADDPEGKGVAGGETAPMAKAMAGVGNEWSWQVRYGWNSDQPYMGFQFNATPRTWVYVGRNLERYEWCHIACSYDGTTVKCYLNGEETDSATMSALASSPTPVLIGSDGWGSDWTGAIDDVRIYNHGVSEGELQAAMATEPILTAYAPDPKDGGMIAQRQATLTWRPGELAGLHEVYFGDSFEAVEAATPADTDVFVGRKAVEGFAVGTADGPYPEGLEHGKTYYWRVDEVNDAHPDSPWKGAVWSLRVQPEIAWNPYPPDGMIHVDPDQDLSWEPGVSFIFHYVHWGESFEQVSSAPTVTGWPTTKTTHEPGPLKLDTTYYWRVDEFLGATSLQGEVWSFTTRGAGGGVKAEYFNGMDLAGEPVLTQIEGSIDHPWGAAEIAAGLSDNVSARWTAALQVPFTETYQLITTSDDGVRLWLDGRLLIDNWTDHGTVDNVAKVDLVAGQIYSLRMEYYENTGGAVAHLSWQSPSQPRQIIPQGWLQLPLWAGSPSPEHGAPHAVQSPILSWTAGDEATHHDLYFGEDAEAVANADTAAADVYATRLPVGTTSYDAGDLEWGKTYYWRVDEIDTANDKQWKGAVWAFTTADFIVVDDFESYTNDFDAGEAIWQTWIDGVENLTGSTVGYWEAPFAETQIVHGGYQSMPLEYDNSQSPYYSEAYRAWTSSQDWTVGGVNTLTLYVRGKGDNDPEPLYVRLEDSSNRTTTVTNPDPDAVLITRWTEWSVPLGDFDGVNPARITKMTIGLGDPDAPKPGGMGLIYIDDIRVTTR